MKKGSLIFSMVLVFTLLLSACSGGNNGNGTNTGYPAQGENATQGIPNTGATEGVNMSTPTVDSTPALDTTEAMSTATATTGEATGEATEQATEEATDATTPTAGAEGNTDTTPTAQAGGETGGGQAGFGTGVIGIPQTGSNGYVGLAAMMDWQVVGTDGSPIGTVQDYVVNTCEAHILYLVVDPAEGVTPQGGQQILIPFEAVLGELNEGSSVDVGQQVFTLKQNAADLANVPGVDIATADLEDPAWSEDVLSYWEGNDYRLSLTAGCPVPVSGEQGGAGGANQQATPGATQDATAQPTFEATPTVESTVTVDAGTGSGTTGDRQNIYRLALASKLIDAELQEGNGRLLGTVQDIAIVQNTGRTQFFVVEIAGSDQGAGRMVALPPGAVNISYENSADQPVVVLLVDTPILQDAPDFDEGAGNSDGEWFNFWIQHIPMTREAMP